MNMSQDPSATFTTEELIRSIKVLENLATDAQLLSQLSSEDRLRLFKAVGNVTYPDHDLARRRSRALRKQKRNAVKMKNRLVRATTTIRTLRRNAVFAAPARQIEALGSDTVPAARLETPRDCYICKKSFTELHFFYDSMCPTCAHFNYEKRFQTAPLHGRTAIITGARLKIGYQAALMMLRAGARVVVTTRFPHDAALRFAREEDFSQWRDRVQVHGLDLRHSPSVEAFCQYMNDTLGRLDILINNAAQTVRRPPGFYAHLLEQESVSYEALPHDVQSLLSGHETLKGTLRSTGDAQWLTEWHAGKLDSRAGITSSAALSQLPYLKDELTTAEHFPKGQLDADLQQVDRRSMNSWRMTMADVPTAELLEVQLINAVAPFILCSKLKPLMMRDRTDQKHMVNVTAVEGKFSRGTKTDKHPHTNMAKAALNMMTFTSARDYVQDGIFMNAVDTGWVTDEDPAALSARKQEDHDFQPPLDIVDGAARICDPFFAGILTGNHSYGCFLKDYFPVEW